jgi:hypothetical protein
MVPCAAQGDQILRLGLTLLNHQTRIAPTTALTCFLILIMALALIVHFVPQWPPWLTDFVCTLILSDDAEHLKLNRTICACAT